MPPLRLATQTFKSTIVRNQIQRTAFAQTRLASQDYGSGEGDPKGEKPQQQGPNPSEKLEHPGPPPPKTGDRTGEGSGSGGKDGGQKKG